jgi:ABC-2 type transport system ATP-binding protein
MRSNAADAAAITTDRLTKRYGDIVAVNGISIEVRKGEVYGFLGPNGAGKTTTMRMLVGLVSPTSGSARVVGYDPGHSSGLARLGAMVEGTALYPFMSGRDNLRLLARHASVPASRVREALETVGLTDRALDRFSTYSLGMKQRLGVAAALLKDPELLILDEPTNGLDPMGMADMRKLIRRLGRAGKAVMLSSHNLAEVQDVCDRVGVIFNGNLVKESTVHDLRGSAHVAIVASPRDQAIEKLKNMLPPERISEVDGQIRVDIEPDKSPWVNRELMSAGIDVYEIRREERSLEEVFMAMSQSYPMGREKEDG